ncbi:hypothetical protein BB562_15495 [Lactiplantibacillus pentosus]|uniref:hypothetical protein n=1 Tax=Lactiplantibacillus pentosus TaxID=1589 RepID=UPI000C7D4F9A|nr:hypothetical protein [Lactiplantibacillus pentosus]AUI79977.1 hypothetical protein BB562_15495 [Lactiplantibacillus pentosus]MCT3064971.1 hypothetical protein [Lactiplantibacillus pentosus]MCT3275883.1 hypothetical protein [Lactiplantibacillus pentosus]PRO90377.1 hypothetical protein C6Y13_05670 [Lactiplantibacillus pentosus]
MYIVGNCWLFQLAVDKRLPVIVDIGSDSGFLREFKSMSALFQRCQPAPEVGLRRASADEQESTNRHALIMIHDKKVGGVQNDFESHLLCESLLSKRP